MYLENEGSNSERTVSLNISRDAVAMDMHNTKNLAVAAPISCIKYRRLCLVPLPQEADLNVEQQHVARRFSGVIHVMMENYSDSVLL
jgi:hypothetical protein